GNVGDKLRSTVPAFIPGGMLPARKGRVVRQLHDACCSRRCVFLGRVTASVAAKVE
ncbi:unnamed protein product, partial [Closterium sp. Naga37s-1]